jgi:triphosphoribosyl-dephospho-CoA synthase
VKALSGIEVGWAAQMSCLFEVNADKPGNVSRSHGFHDARFEDYAVSALAIGPAFQEAADATVGEIVLRAVTDTHRFVSTNTNLGIVLLLAPLAKAASGADTGDLRSAVGRVLADLTADDAEKAYEAMRIASPSGLGEVDQYDVASGSRGATLREVMHLASGRDSVAREYVTDFEICFGTGYETMRREWATGLSLSDAVVQTFLTVLARVPDTLIARKQGIEASRQVSRRAAEVLASGGVHSARGREDLIRLDHDLRDASHRLNPGTTADLVAASLFIFLVEGEMLHRTHELMERS